MNDRSIAMSIAYVVAALAYIIYALSLRARWRKVRRRQGGD
jgi:hypothetical protein